jgi:hypothetical protein
MMKTRGGLIAQPAAHPRNRWQTPEKQMPRQIIDADTRLEIRASLAGLASTPAAEIAQQWAKRLDVDISRIYAVTKDVRPVRKPRSDKGKTKADIFKDPGSRFATQFVVADGLDPALALETARANGFATPFSTATYRKQLLKAGLNRKQMRSLRSVVRRFAAKLPGEIFQFDLTGLKTRWLDPKTRRILKVTNLQVSKNHPNTSSRRVKIWVAVVKDDCSRKIFFRFIAVDKPDSRHIMDFLLECFREMGVPLSLYTDNDSVIGSHLCTRGYGILNRVFAESGGFEHKRHLPGNSKATGKVENAHKDVEKYERLIGLCGEEPTIDDLNKFAANVCEKYNWNVHRDTGEMPEITFRKGHGVMRVAPPEALNDAFKTREIEVKVNPDVTISVDGTAWQLPRAPMIGPLRDQRNPFPDLAILGKRVSVIWPSDAEWFLALNFELPKVAAVADGAGEFKSVAMSDAERNANHFKEMARETKHMAREARKRGETLIARPGFEVPFESAAMDRPAIMPRKQISASLAEWAKGGDGAVAPSMVDGRPIDYWTALSSLIDEGALTAGEPDKAWLRSVFGIRDEIMDTELRAAVDARAEVIANQPKVVEMKTA